MTRLRDNLGQMLRLTRRPLALAGLIVVVLMIIVGALAPQLAPHDPTEPGYDSLLQPPNSEHLMGTDELGRDILSRVIYGTRVSLQAGIISVGLAVAVGVPIGLLSGYYRGIIDEYLIMRITDAMMSFPTLILALALAAVLGPSLQNVMIAIGIVYTPTFIRLTRGQVLSVRETEFAEAAEAVGAPDLRIMVRHVLPNSLTPVMVQASINVASAILIEAGLSYLGLGVQPPTPSWGSMLRDGYGFLEEAPWMSVWPGMAIFVAVLGINLFGDGVRDIFDPRQET